MEWLRLNARGQQVESREEADCALTSTGDGGSVAAAHNQDTDPIDKEQAAGTHVVAYVRGAVGVVDSMNSTVAGFEGMAPVRHEAKFLRRDWAVRKGLVRDRLAMDH